MTPVSPEGLLALVKRLEEASGPDRELDGRILWAVQRASATRAYWQVTTGKPRPLSDEYPPRGLGTFNIETVTPRYTSSIDAALELVPMFLDRDVKLTISMNTDDPETDVDFEEWTDTGPHVETRSIGSGRGSPAIALCIAALRASVSNT